MRSLYVLLIVLVTLGVGVLTAAFMHDEGLEGLTTDLFGDGRRYAGQEPDLPTPPTSSPKSWEKRDAVKKLARADKSYDEGDFHNAVLDYSAAHKLAVDPSRRRRAREGLGKAVLADCLVRGALPQRMSRDQALRKYERAKQEAESLPSETAWFKLVRFTAGADLREQLPYCVDRCLDAAVTGGPAESHVLKWLEASGGDPRPVLEALRARGLAVRVPKAITARANRKEWRPEDSDDGESSGIGSVGTRKTSIPYGVFDAEMRKRLGRAAELQDLGAYEYKLSGPNGTDRKSHRKKALTHLKEARAIYQDALAADSKSGGVETRLSEVNRMIVGLNKDRVLGE